jgi:hypothetical protein
VPKVAASAPPDYVARIADAARDLGDTHHRPLISAAAPASASEAQRRRLLLRALFKLMARGQSPEQVRQIIEAAPRPPELDETPDERERRERHEARQGVEAERFGQAVGETQNALDAVPGSFSGGL